jgi:hypothetical protein
MAGRTELEWWKSSKILSGGKADRRAIGGRGSTVRLADITNRERSCMALASEQRWSKTELKSKEGGGGCKEEEVDGEEALSGIIPRGDKVAG